jgi:carbamoyl-phosphate synthase large subunit
MMHAIDATIAVTGVNATDNPAPGVAVARALRHEPAFAGRVIGLGYEALDPGFYAPGLLDGGAILPYPSHGRAAFFERVKELQKVFGIEALLPTLDSELRSVARLESDLAAIGIRTFVPALDTIERASKPQLHRLADGARIRVPDSETVATPDGFEKLVRRFGLPLVVKGLYYGAQIVHSEADALAAFHCFAATWGVPVIVQRFIDGIEFNVAAIGDGTGRMRGAVAMRKLALTDKGKGWSGVTVDNPDLMTLAESVVGALSWRGPLEVEVLSEQGGDMWVIEINPRFPAWIYLAAGAGQNLPYVCALLALGLPTPRELPPYRVGTMFVRISLDQIADLDIFARLSASGVLEMRQETPA